MKARVKVKLYSGQSGQSGLSLVSLAQAGENKVPPGQDEILSQKHIN